MISLFHIFSKDGDYVLKGLPHALQVMYHLSHFAMAIFFLLSGFVIGKIIFFTPVTPFKFFTQRFLRIYLLYWVFFFLSLALFLFLPQYYHYWELTPQNFFQDLLLLPNTYFGNERFSLLFVSWTLSYEIFFYLLGTISLFIKSRLMKFIFIVTCIFLPSWLHSVGLIKPYFFTSNNLILIGLGVIASAVNAEELKHFIKEKLSRPLFMDYITAGITLIFLKGFIIKFLMFIMYLISDSETLLAIFFAILLFLFSKKMSSDNPVWKGLVALGERSYSFYLSHTLVILIYTQTLISQNIKLHWSIFTTGAFLALFSAGLLSYRLIECPIEQWRKRILRD